MLGLPMLSLAAEIKYGRDLMFPKGETVSDDLYLAGGTVTVASDISGDLIAAGGNVFVSGTVSQDIWAASGNVNITGAVRDDVRAAGGNVTVSGNVAGDVLVAGGTVHIAPGVVVNGDVISAGGNVIIDGKVNGNVEVAGGQITINDIVGGNVVAKADTIMIGRTGDIRGSLEYTARKPETLSNQGKIAGSVTFHERVGGKAADARAAFAGLVAIGVLIKLLMALVAGLVAIRLFPRFSGLLVQRTISGFGGELLRGIVLAIVLPICAIIAAVTVIGIPFTVALFLISLLFALIASVYSGILVGSWVEKKIMKRPEYRVHWKAATGGIVLLFILQAIPFLGPIATIVIMLSLFGSLFHLAHERFWLNR